MSHGLDPGIFIVLSTFVGTTSYVIVKYKKINKELKKVVSFLENFRKNDLVFRFKEFDSGMTSNPYVCDLWEAFKNTLMFSETMAIQGSEDELKLEKLSESVENIQCTVEPACFFNDETMISSRLNARLVSIAPTLLTGLGPLFTFMHIGQAFSKVDFSSQENTIASVGGLMTSMQAAAMVSVLAVGASLIFLTIEKNMLAIFCKKPLAHIEEMLSKLFDSISSEKFLIELLRENKKQNAATTSLLRVIPSQFSESLNTSLSAILLPYLDNVLYSLNKLQDKMAQAAASSKKGGDAVDDLF
ncbi:hypothetical protein IJ732_01910 [bacterium]|nr:hypothetical protein [bacterium]